MNSVSFFTVLASISSAFLLAAIGFAASKRKQLDDHSVSQMTRILTDYILPIAFFGSMYEKYGHDRVNCIAIAGISQCCFFIAGTLAAKLLIRITRYNGHRPTVETMSALQNNTYLPIAMLASLLPPDQQTDGLFYVGCFILFFTPMLWTIGVARLSSYSLTHGHNPTAALELSGKSIWKRAITKPFLGAIAGIICKEIDLATGIAIPASLLNFCKMCVWGMGPIAMIILGAIIAGIRWKNTFDLKSVIIITIAKLLIVPALCLTALMHMDRSSIPALLVFVIFLESCMPSPADTSVICKRYGGNVDLTASVIVITYIICMATVPLWLSFGMLYLK